MSRQSASKRMFGLVMITVTMLLVACGGGDGEADPTATSAANEAAPTLPAGDSTAEVQATEDISEDDLTVVEPEIPAASVTAEEEVALVTEASPAVGTPSLSTDVPGTPAAVEASSAVSPESAPTDLTGSGTTAASTTSAGTVQSTPVASEAVAQTNSPVADATPPQTPAAEIATTSEVAPATADVAGEADTATNVTASPAAAVSATPGSGQFNTAGDGTGGSGQPGERSSNVAGEDAAASPVAGISVEGCEVPNVPAFEGATAYITNAEVNFRSGPGTECDAILDEPLGPDVAVEVIGGPVTQSADDTVWLQVEVDGVPGWVSEEFIEPAE